MKEDSDERSAITSHDFLDLMRRLEIASAAKPRIGESADLSEDVVSLGQMPHINFSDSNVDVLDVLPDGRRRVLSRFLGLLGPQGALPLHNTYEAVHWQHMRDPAFARFLDVFNNRFQQLFFRAWANARPAVQADRPKSDQFLGYIGASVGITTPAMRNRDSLHDFTKSAVAGLLAPSVKSAARIENLLAWLFNAKVTVQQFVGVWLALEEREQAALAKDNCSLGVDSIIGRSAFSLRDKFRIRIRARDLAEFESFLPDGKYFRLLSDAVTFYIGNLFIYDVEIGLPLEKAKPVCLGQFGRLGWTSWMQKPEPSHVGTNATIRWDCRFHPSVTNNT